MSNAPLVSDTTEMTGLSVVIAPDSFKGTVTAADVARALAEGWLSVRPDDSIIRLPLADGGEGTLDAIEAATPGAFRRDAGVVSGPDGRPVLGQWLELPDSIGVIELAQMSGLPLMRQLDARGASTYGLGQVIAHALDNGMQRLIIGLGGSASTDGGGGALTALGLIDPGAPEALDTSALRPPPPGGVILLTDVSAPLLGPTGAAAVFGPQKGADPDDIRFLDSALATFARRLGGNPNEPGAGAAGGAAYGFAAAWGATIRSGAEYITGLSGMLEASRSADVVLTGEGRFDETSLSGKLVGEVIRIACSGSARVGVVAGAVAIAPLSPEGKPLWSCALVDLAGSTAEAMANADSWLRTAGARAAVALGT